MTKRKIKIRMQDDTSSTPESCTVAAFTKALTQAMSRGATVVSSPTVEAGHFVIAVHPDDFRSIGAVVGAAGEQV